MPKHDDDGVRSHNRRAPRPPGRPPFERLRAGEIGLGEYLDAKVDEVTLHLHGLGKRDLSRVRTRLRELAETDPTVVELVRSMCR
jgi:hypothetical protein